MSVKIRLARRGRKKKATYDVIVADARSPRDGRIIEKLGTYNPLTNPATIAINVDKTLEWLMKGAQPTDTAKRILSHKGILLKKHLQIGVLKGAITQEQADKKFADWLEVKEAEISGNLDSLTKKKADEAKARLDAEKKVNEAKAEALKKKLAALVPKEEAPAEEEAPVEEKVVEKPKAATKEAETPKVEKTVEEAKTETAKEPKAEAVETPAAEEKKEEAPKEEVKAEEKVEETKAEAKPIVKKSEETVVEKKEASTEEKKEEEKK